VRDGEPHEAAQAEAEHVRLSHPEVVEQAHDVTGERPLTVA